MKLSTLYTSVPEYIEFGWVTAPDTAGQSISANTITPLTLDTEVADTGNLVSAPSSNEFTLPAGTYYFEANVAVRFPNTNMALTFSLNNVTTSENVTGARQGGYLNTARAAGMFLNGQMVLSATTTLQLTLLCSGDATVDNGELTTVHTNSTAGADQRTTIKLWKLK